MTYKSNIASGMLRRLVAPLMVAAGGLGAAVSLSGCGEGSDTETVERLLGGMTLREKVGQLLMVEIGGEPSPSLADTLVTEYGVGGLIVMDAPVGSIVGQLATLQAGAAVPLLVSVDAEWGLSMRCPEYPRFPRQGELGLLPDAGPLVYEMGRTIGRELREIGMHIDFAPVVDVNTNPDVQVLGTRAFGSSEGLVADYGSAYMHGLQDEGISACAKHFPGHGEASVDSHKSLPVLELGRERLDSVELMPFRRLIAEGVDMVMVGHLGVPALDPSLTPASISKPIVTDILKGELGFGGIVITDALEMRGLINDRDSCEVVLEAYRAGADILLMPKDPVGAFNLLVSRFEDGTLPVSGLDERVRKILLFKARHGLFRSAPHVPAPEALPAIVREAVERDSALIVRMSEGM